MTDNIVTFSLGCVRDTGTPKGRGVFATRAIAAGEIVEVCPVIVLPVPHMVLPVRLRSYFFDWGSLTGGGASHALALGYGSIYNHANPSNLRHQAITEAGCMRYVAVRDIVADEELTINYCSADGSETSNNERWFAQNGIRPWVG